MNNADRLQALSDYWNQLYAKAWGRGVVPIVDATLAKQIQDGRNEFWNWRDNLVLSLIVDLGADAGYLKRKQLAEALAAKVGMGPLTSDKNVFQRAAPAFEMGAAYAGLVVLFGAWLFFKRR